MAISRGSMTKEMFGNRTKKFGGGGLLNLSPAASLAKSIQTGQPEGILKATPLGMMVRANTPAGAKQKKPAPAAMKSGGKVMRGCGCAIRGTKGKGNI